MFGSVRPDLRKMLKWIKYARESCFSLKIPFPRNPKLGAQKIAKTKNPKSQKIKTQQLKTFFFFFKVGYYGFLHKLGQGPNITSVLTMTVSLTSRSTSGHSNDLSRTAQAEPSFNQSKKTGASSTKRGGSPAHTGEQKAQEQRGATGTKSSTEVNPDQIPPDTRK